MKIQAALIVALTLSGCQAFVPSSVSRAAVQRHSADSTVIAPHIKSFSQQSRQRTSSKTTNLSMASAEDFDQTKYTEAAWATLAALPACADSYSATSVEAPMLLGIMLNPTKYQAGELRILLDD